MFKFRLNKSAEQIIRDSGINGDSALYAAHEARILMHGYVPRDTGALAVNANVSANAGNGTSASVHYTQPYAAFCYYGDRKVFSRDKHEKATAYWDTAMILAHRGALTKSVNDFIKNKNR
jgi:hypothetical protein